MPTLSAVPDLTGRFGPYGGTYVPETLVAAAPLVLVGAAALVLVGGYAAAVLAMVGAWSTLALAVAAREASGERRRQLSRAARRVQRWAPVALFATGCLLSLGATDPHSAAAPQLAVLAALVALWVTAAGRKGR